MTAIGSFVFSVAKVVSPTFQKSGNFLVVSLRKGKLEKKR